MSSNSFWELSPYGYGRYLSVQKFESSVVESKSDLLKDVTDVVVLGTNDETSKNENIQENYIYQNSKIEYKDVTFREESKSIFFDNPMSFANINKLLEIQNSSKNTSPNDSFKIDHITSFSDVSQGFESVRSFSINLTSSTASEDTVINNNNNNDILRLRSTDDDASCTITEDILNENSIVFDKINSSTIQVTNKNRFNNDSTKTRNDSNKSNSPPAISKNDIIFYEFMNEEYTKELNINNPKNRYTFDNKLEKIDSFRSLSLGGDNNNNNNNNNNSKASKNRSISSLYKKRYHSFSHPSGSKDVSNKNLKNSETEKPSTGKVRSYVNYINNTLLRRIKSGFKNEKTKTKKVEVEEKLDTFDYNVFIR